MASQYNEAYATRTKGNGRPIGAFLIQQHINKIVFIYARITWSIEFPEEAFVSILSIMRIIFFCKVDHKEMN